MSTPPPLEIPIFCPRQCRQAVVHGAARIELNASGSYPQGGLTPSLDELRAVREFLDSNPSPGPGVAVRVMIRPRCRPPGGAEPDFLYSPAELEAMRAAAAEFRGSGLLREQAGDGFVFGCLKRAAGEGGRVEVDAAANRMLVDAVRPFKCVFHRAFDDVVASSTAGGKRWSQGLEQIVACGFDGILTSGRPGNAPDNVESLKIVVEAAQGRVEIIVGGGLRSGNVASLAEVFATPGARIAAHSSCLRAGAVDEGINEQEVINLVEKLSSTSTS